MVKRSKPQQAAGEGGAAVEGGAISKKKTAPSLPEDVKLETYIARVHKQLQKEGDGRTISSGALASLDEQLQRVQVGAHHARRHLRARQREEVGRPRPE